MRRSIGYMGIIVVILVFIVSTSGCTTISQVVNSFSNSTGNGTFSAYGVSFNYPNGWLAFADNQTGSKTIDVSKDNSFNGVQLTMQIMDNNGLSEKGVINMMENSQTKGWKKISNSTTTIDGQKAYMDVFIYKSGDSAQNMRFEQVYFVKNDTTYLMLLQAPDKDFDKEKSNFDIILNSMKIQ